MTSEQDETGSIPEGLASTPIPWAESHCGGGRVLFTRLLARRNFAGSPFWVSSTPETCAQIAERATTLARARGLGPGTALASLSSAQIGVLRERMVLPERPVSTPATRTFKKVFLGNIPGEHALFGETEHWTHVRYAFDETGRGRECELPLEALTAVACTFDSDAQECGPEGALFARSPSWGFLTSNPAHAGSGLQCEAGLHLPALTATRSIPQMRLGMAAMGFELLPLSLREPGAAEAGFFRFVARGGPEHDGLSLCQRFADKAGQLLAAERTVWEDWLRREGPELTDRMSASLRGLLEAQPMDFAELQSLVSFARAGVYAGLFPSVWIPRLEALRVRSAPSHLRTFEGSKGGTMADSGRTFVSDGINRAALARELLSES